MTRPVFSLRVPAGGAIDLGGGVTAARGRPDWSPDVLFRDADGAAVLCWRHAPVFSPTHLFPQGTDGAAVEFFRHEV